MTTRASSRKLRLRRARNSKCTDCTLSSTTSGNVCVFGKGDPTWPIMLIGEAPGEAEERTGKPFMGASGRLLDIVLDRVGLRNLCYITNAVRCRPPSNRTPRQAELDACHKYLDAEVAIVQPQVIVTLGATARKALGFEGRMGEGGLWVRPDSIAIPIFFTYHPAFCLRAGNVGINEFSRHLTSVRQYYENLPKSPRSISRD